MTSPAPSPRRRKLRMLRPGAVADDLLVLIRAATVTAEETVEDIAADALASALIYVIESRPGYREPLFGVSVFARPPGVDVRVVLARFKDAPTFIEASVNILRSNGFSIWPTGGNTEHFDVQLLPGHSEDDVVPADTVRQAAAKLVSASGDLHPNPAYAE